MSSRIHDLDRDNAAIDLAAAPMTLSAFAENHLEFKGAPLSFGKYPYMYDPIDDGHRQRVFVWARQTGKSLAEGAVMLGVTSMYPYTTATYISSAIKNTSIFESQKLKPLMQSPKWREKYLIGGGKENVYEKMLSNGSQIILLGGGNEERVRGISGGLLFVDELQDVDRSVIETAESLLTREETQIMVLGGTQSHLESSVNYYWDLSSRQEWLVRCSHCGKFSDALGESNIGLKSLICANCGGAMNTAADRGEWIKMGPADAQFSGYRFPLIALPDHPWNDVINKKNSFSPQKFSIDVLALPYDFSGKPISRAELMALCQVDPRVSWYSPKECLGYRTVAGVDWGQGNNATTQIAVLVEMGRVLKIAYMKKFTGDEADPISIREAVARICSDYNCAITAVDKGGQWETVPMLQRHYLGSEKLQTIQLGGNLAQVMTWNKKDGYWLASKVETLSATFMAFKQQKILPPAWSLFQPFGEEILNEVTVNDEDTGRIKFEKMPARHDDSLHAINFALCAYNILIGVHTKLPAGTRLRPSMVMG